MSPALLLAAACLLAVPRVAAAQTWGASVTLASEHLLRGISRSDGDPSLSAEAHVQGAPGLFASLWAATSRVHGGDTFIDASATLGAAGSAGRDAGWRLAWSHYRSAWQQNAGWYRYNEFTADLQLRDALLVSLNWSPDTMVYSTYAGGLRRRNVLGCEASLQQHLVAGWRAFGGAGYRDFPGLAGADYWYGSVGVGWARRHWESDLSYVHAGEGAAEVAWPGRARSTLLLRVTHVF